MKYAETCWTYGVRFCKSNVMSNGHLSCMFILVHRIAYKKILQFSELQDYSLSFIRLLWRWRDSNSRPNAERTRFLHAYLQVGCRLWAGMKPPTRSLSPKISVKPRSGAIPILEFPSTTLSKRLKARQSGDVSFPPLWWKLS